MEYTNDLDKAQARNDHFSTVGTKLANVIQSDIDHENYLHPNPPIFDIKPVDLKSVAEAVRDLRPSTSCGVDGLTSRLIKQCGPSVFKPLQYVITLSIEQHTFPDAWKTGSITSLKRG